MCPSSLRPRGTPAALGARTTSKYDELRSLYAAVFSGRTDRIPLIVTVPCEGGPSIGALWRDTERAVAAACGSLAPRVAVESDWLPSVNLSLFQCIVVPSLFGAAIRELEGSEPICDPLFASIGAALDAGVPELAGPAVDDMLAVCRAARRGLHDGFFLSMPVAASPIDLAQLLLGAEFFVALMTEPDGAHEFLLRLARLAIGLTAMVKAEMGQPRDELVTNRGIVFPGFRQPCDAIVNLSPDLLRRFVLPVLGEIRRAFGPLCIHFCTEPAPSRHVLPVLLESPDVIAVDNWQGPDVFIGDGAPARMQAKIAVIGDADLTTPEKMDAFLAREAVRGVPRRGGRGLVLTTHAASVEDGRRIYARWVDQFQVYGNNVALFQAV